MSPAVHHRRNPHGRASILQLIMPRSTDTDTEDRREYDPESGPSTRHVKWTEVVAEAAADGLDMEDETEVNVILISHPEDEKLGRRWSLRRGTVMEIGRSSSADISLPDALSVSRRHATLRFLSDGVALEDHESTNGTYINGRSITGRAQLRSGDRFQVGTVHFKFLQELDVENAYYETLYQLAVRDGLTEIFNKRKFDEELEREFQRSSRYERPLSLILLDLDHFKAVNDTHGHLCGDHVLKEVTRVVSGHLRPEQTFARVGGEELVILSPETEVEGAVQLAEKLRQEIADSRFSFAGISVNVTCSFGVAAKSDEAASATALFGSADQALYRAKSDGRNCTRAAGAD